MAFDISSILTTANPLVGGILGAVGAIATGIMNYKSQKLKYEHDREVMAHELNVIKAESDANVKIIETQTRGTIDLADANAYRDSQKYGNLNMLASGMIEKLSEMKTGEGATPWFARTILTIIVLLLSLVDFLKGLMRPGLTAYHVILTTYITATAWQIARTQNVIFGADDAVRIIFQVVNTVLFLTVTCVTWWFGDRRMAKFLMRLNDGNIKSQR